MKGTTLCPEWLGPAGRGRIQPRTEGDGEGLPDSVLHPLPPRARREEPARDVGATRMRKRQISKRQRIKCPSCSGRFDPKSYQNHKCVRRTT